MPFPYGNVLLTSRALACRSNVRLQPPVNNGMHLDIDVSLGSFPFARRYLGNLF